MIPQHHVFSPFKKLRVCMYVINILPKLPHLQNSAGKRIVILSVEKHCDMQTWCSLNALFSWSAHHH